MGRIEIKEVSKAYGTKLAVNRVSFVANPGEVLGFLGPNGAGKTTTIRMMMGITAPDSGSIDFIADDGSKHQGIPQSQIGYLPEERGLYKEARVLSVLCFLAELKNINHAVAREAAMQWLNRFGLQDYAYAKVEELSKGMAQKVQFIGAIMHQPKYLILDEPFSGLDPVSQDVFKRELRALSQSGATVILSGHQMNILEELCDKIFLIHQGTEVFNGSINQIKDRYGSYMISLRTNSMATVDFVKGLDLVAGCKPLADNSYRISLKEGIKPAQFLSAIPANLDVEELSLMRSSLHDIFVQIAMGGTDHER